MRSLDFYRFELRSIKIFILQYLTYPTYTTLLPMRSEKDYLYAIASSTALNKCLSSPAVSQLPEKTLALIKQSAENSSLLLTEVRIIHLTPQLSSPGYFHSKTSTEIIASSTQDSSVMLSISQPARSIDVLPYPILYNTLWYLVGNSRAYQVCEYGLVKRTFYHCLRDLVSRRITLSANSRFQSRIAGYHLYSLIGHVYPSVKTLVFVVPEKVNIELIRIFAGTMKTITSLTLDFALIEDDVSYTCAVIDLFYTYCKLVTRFKLAETGRIPADEVTGEIKIGLEKLESLTLVNYRFRNDHLFSDSYFNKLTVFSFSEENSERISTSLKRGLMRFAAECPNLKSLTLHMELVYLDHEIVQGFVMNSPLIESLELSEIEISMQLLTRICRYYQPTPYHPDSPVYPN
jgi:hypothetical protein